MEDLLDRRIYQTEGDVSYGSWWKEKRQFVGIKETPEGLTLPYFAPHQLVGYAGVTYAVRDLGLDLGREIPLTRLIGVYTEEGRKVTFSDVKQTWVYADGTPIEEGTKYHPAVNDALVEALWTIHIGAER